MKDLNNGQNQAESINQPKEKKQRDFTALSGVHKIMPIILGALALFLFICLLIPGDGLIGRIIRPFLMGLFGKGAFAIPAALVIHAICYAGDYEDKRIKKRAIFSAVCVVLFSAVDYGIFSFGTGSALLPWNSFVYGCRGGFIGNIVGFIFGLLLGSIGTIIISLAIMAIYLIFFYAEKAGSLGQAAIKLSGDFKALTSLIKAKIQDNKDRKKQIAEDAAQLQREVASEELIDDEFFTTKEGNSGVKVKQLGIDEESSPLGTSPLMNHANQEPEEEVVITKHEKKKKDKPLDLSYGLDSTPAKKNEPKPYSKAFFGLDDSADNVFTKDFDPFDFASSEKAAAKYASKVSGPSAVEEEMDEFTIYEMKANHVPTEREKKIADLEQRRKEWFHYKHKKEIENNPVLAAEEKARREAEELNIHTKPLFDSVSDPAVKPEGSSYISTDSPAPFHRPTGGYTPSRTPVQTTRSFGFGNSGAVSTPVTPAPAPTPVESTPVAEPQPVVTPTPAPAPQHTEQPKPVGGISVFDSYANARSSYQRPIKTVEFTITKEPKPEPEPFKAPETAPGAPMAEATEDVAILIANRIAKSTPGYLRSANEMKTFTKVKSSSSDDELLRILSGAPAVEEPKPAEAETVTEETAADAEEVIVFEEEKTPDPVEFSFGEPVETTSPETTPESSYKRAAGFASAMVSEGDSTPTFKAYSPAAELNTESVSTVESTLKAERSMLSPTTADAFFTAVNESNTQSETEINFTTYSPASTEKSEVVIPLFDTVAEERVEEIKPASSELVFEWEDTSAPEEPEEDEEDDIISFPDEEEEDEEELDESFDKDEIPEEETEEITEIPPEEQNPDVKKMREMFPFLKSLDEQAKEAAEAKKAQTPTPKAEETPIAQTPAEEDRAPWEEAPAEEAPKVPFEAIKRKGTKAELGPKPTELVPVEEKKASKPDYSNYEFPSIELLTKEESLYDSNTQVEIQENADKLIETLASFGVTASIKGYDRGPRITRFEVVPAKGVKVSQILNLQDDIALNLAAGSIRMEAPIPGKSAVGIEIPNKKSSIVRLRDLLESAEFKYSTSKTLSCVGRDIAGQPVFGDLASMPHLLIAGATGMGKSVCINSLLISILYKARPDEVKFIMIDPKQVEFTMYDGIPHLLVPVVSDPKKAAGALMWAVEEMERRFERLRPLCVRNVDAYNEKVNADPSLGEPMSKIIIVIDEFADLMLQVKDPVETLVMRIAQKARAAGIHLVIGTQRPSVNVITGVIKANVPSRISCKVMSNVDSKTILDMGGAEKLLDKGDSLYAPKDAAKPHRVQCAFVSDGEVESVMSHLRKFSTGDNYDSEVMAEIERAAQKCSKKGGSDRDDDDDGNESSGEGYLNDRQFLDAVEVAVNTRKISTSLIQRKLSIGYGKAAKFIDIMEDMGIVGEANGQRPREVLLTPDEWREKLARASLD